MMRFCWPILAAALLAACGPSGPHGPVEVAVIGSSESLFQQGVRLSTAAQHLRAATHEGLVALDATGQAVPALAERWIVTDDGLSYIFKLRDSAWPDGEAITAREVQRLLRADLAGLRGTSLGLDLTKIVEIRAMAGRVIEIRLSSPIPDLLHLLAQPELGLSRKGAGTGPMRMEQEAQGIIARLVALPPESRGLPAREDWQAAAREIRLRALPGARAVAAFSSGEVDVVLGGTVTHLPLADTGPLSRGTVRLDAALGVFGLIARNEKGVLATPELREALAMAIDRAALVQPFNIGGWEPSTWIVPRTIGWSAGPRAERWSDFSLDQRRAIAGRRIAAWKAANGGEANVRIGLPVGPGSDLLFQRIAADLRTIGVTAQQVPQGQRADLELVDRLARFLGPRWYLNQFNCGLDLGLCSQEADELVAQAVIAQDQAVEQQLLAEAQRRLIERQAFIPLGAPIRWSLVRGSIAGFAENPWGLHPLFPLSEPTI